MPATDHLGGQFRKKRTITPGMITTVWPSSMYGGSNDDAADDAGDVDSGDDSGDVGDGGE